MKTRRVFAALSVVASVAVAPMVTATAAHAAQSTCVNYLGNKGYLVGPKVKAACSHPALQSPLGKIPNPACLTGLGSAGVREEHIPPACDRA